MRFIRSMIADAAAVSAALALDGSAWVGAAAAASAKTVSVRRAEVAKGDGDAEPSKRPRAEEAAARPPSLSVFVGNLPADASKKDVKGALLPGAFPEPFLSVP